MQRRTFIQRCTAVAGGALLARQALAQSAAEPRPGAAIVVDPAPLFDISPWLHMQFMEPLGLTDASVEGSWDHRADDWRADFIETTRDLAPDLMRFGGIYSRYYKWREGIGPAAERPRHRNYMWDGWESNRVGTHEFADYCQRVGCEGFYCVNFLGDGREEYRKTPEGDRTGDAREAADWVSYCNDPSDRERRANGHPEPFNLRLWQLGNETSYAPDNFSKDDCIAHTIDFAKAMRERDPALQLIAWGDLPGRGEAWAGDMIERAGEQIDHIAMHMMGQSPQRKDTVLAGNRYQSNPEQAWQELAGLADRVEQRLRRMVEIIDAKKTPHGLAVTEGHLSLSPRNLNPILTEWLTGVYHARSMNSYQRAGARVKIATCADFNGNRWTSSALLLQIPGRLSYLLPAGAVMRLFKHHNGRQAIAVTSAPGSLDIAASRTGKKVFLHVANKDFNGSTEVSFSVKGETIIAARVLAIAPDSLRHEASEINPRAFQPQEHVLPPAETYRWRVPAASVSAVELDCA